MAFIILNFGKADFEKAISTKPKFNEHKSIAQRLNSLNQKPQTECICFHKQQMLKAALMSDVLSGNKRVKVDKKYLAKTAV
ncbi:MAG: hypothetical protein A2W30_08915 [Ignavibacteria bacterium RBG_16_36_9]|nr:MAG: hypothetical protein A2W30_08915 [Ignavibacteria bacterium RBG_16_36_9]